MLSENLKIRAASISICCALSLAILKLIVALTSGSMAVMASAVDSLLDILMSGVNLMAIRHAEQPPDQCHPFGHGKFETLATLFQAIVILATSGWIIIEATSRLAKENQPSHLNQGIAVLAFSTVASWFIARYLQSVAKKTDSSALEADALHFHMDIFTNLGLLIGLLVVNWLQVFWLDSALSILVASYILHEALQLIKRGFTDLLDHQLPDEIQNQVHHLIRTFNGPLAGYHGLRTRRAGSLKIMDFHLEVCKEMTVFEAHKLADALEKRIEGSIQGADVIIHIEPCQETHCPGSASCEMTKSRIMNKSPRKSTEPPLANH